MNFFKVKVDEFDPSKVYTDSIFLMEPQMCKRPVKYCAPIFHFSTSDVFSWWRACLVIFSGFGAVEVRKYFNFLFWHVKTLTFPQKLVLKACRNYNILVVVQIMQFMPNS